MATLWEASRSCGPRARGRYRFFAGARVVIRAIRSARLIPTTWNIRRPGAKR